MSQTTKRMSAREARQLGRTKSQEQLRAERGFTDQERRDARAWFEARHAGKNGAAPGSEIPAGAPPGGPPEESPTTRTSGPAAKTRR